MAEETETGVSELKALKRTVADLTKSNNDLESRVKAIEETLQKVKAAAIDAGVPKSFFDF